MIVSLWVPPPVWLNCLSPTPIMIIYPPSPLQFYISLHCCRLFILSLYVYINSVSCQVAFTIFRICILSQYKIFILILFFVEFFEIIWLIFEKSLFLSYILRSDNIYNLCHLHFYKFWAAIFGSKKDIKKSKRHKQFTIHNANK